MAASGGLDVLISLAWLLSVITRASQITILTSNEMHTRRLGESLTLSCEFRAAHFNLFDNPVLWKKKQHHEETQVNIQGNLNLPFLNTGRYRVKFTPLHPMYRFELTIVDLRREDNGNYSCEVRGETSRVLANVTHTVIVRAPVEHSYITNSNVSDQKRLGESPSELVFTENVPGTLRCVTNGSYPAPDIQVSVGDLNIGKHLQWKYEPLFSGPKGLRRLAFIVERFSSNFMALPQYDGEYVFCAALVPSLMAENIAVKIRVNYPPKVFCEDAYAQLGERNVSIVCTVTSRPRATSVRWLQESAGKPFDVLSSTAFSSSNKVLNDTSLLAILHISHTGPRRFRGYRVIAKNAIGSTTHSVLLHRKIELPPKTSTVPSTTNPYTSTGPGSHSDSGSHYIFIISKAPSSVVSSTTFQLVLFSLAFSFIFEFHSTSPLFAFLR